MHPHERLARLEAQMEQLLITAARAHADLKEHIDWQRRTFEKTDARLDKLDRNAEQVHTHLRWMKAIWVAVQSTVIGWLGLK
ncbi:MAG TPA: hypothetical protein VEJ63_08840 [Planctomycetota bacterium]|nr:hypothetical protein [Planctomycetota bacterium]